MLTRVWRMSMRAKTTGNVTAARVFLSSEAAGGKSKEAIMQDQLRSALEATEVEVVDISGGCGSMYKVEIESPKFAGVPLVKQHRMVTEILRSDISEMHGLTITTKVPPS